jgi:hypothetical protein
MSAARTALSLRPLRRIRNHRTGTRTAWLLGELALGGCGDKGTGSR